MKPLVTPQVNINGTTRERLVEQQVAVSTALRVAYDAMAEASPHARDFQPYPQEWTSAVEAWHERMLALHMMRKDIEVHAMRILRGENDHG